MHNKIWLLFDSSGFIRLSVKPRDACVTKNLVDQNKLYKHNVYTFTCSAFRLSPDFSKNVSLPTEVPDIMSNPPLVVPIYTI